MAILGLGKPQTDTNSKKASSNKDDSDNSQAEEAKAMLEKMEAKKNANECPFC